MNDTVQMESARTCCLTNRLRGKTWNYVLKFLATSACLMFFFANSFLIFEEFASGKTILASNYMKKQRVHFPIMVICSYSAYRESEMDKLGLSDYLNNTLKIEDVLESISVGDARSSYPIYNDTYHSGNLSVSPIYTYYRGQCFAFKYKLKVPPQEQLNFNLRWESQVWIYLVEYGYEFFMPYDFWPDPMPPVIGIGKSIKSQDINIRIQEIHRTKDCMPEVGKVYTECLRRAFREYTYDNRHKYPNCTTPWHQDLLGMRNYTEKDFAACNEKQKQKLVQLDTIFMKDASTSRIQKCQEPCVFVSYEAKTLYYDQHSALSVLPHKKVSKKISGQIPPRNATEGQNTDYINGEIDYRLKIGKEILLYYSTTTVKVISEAKMINFPNFVSAVGGNLGLFVGFSFLGFFSYFYASVKRLCTQADQK